jgi:DNA repair exonuclease SbcCD ATPase subunit
LYRYAEEQIERDRDAYVMKRRKELKDAATKEGLAAQKLVSEVGKQSDALEKAQAAVSKAEKFLAELEEKSETLRETLKQKAHLAKQRVDDKNAKVGLLHKLPESTCPVALASRLFW